MQNGHQQFCSENVECGRHKPASAHVVTEQVLCKTNEVSNINLARDCGDDSNRGGNDIHLRRNMIFRLHLTTDWWVYLRCKTHRQQSNDNHLVAVVGWNVWQYWVSIVYFIALAGVIALSLRFTTSSAAIPNLVRCYVAISMKKICLFNEQILKWCRVVSSSSWIER